MKATKLLFTSAILLALTLLCGNNIYAQHRNNSGNHRTETSRGKTTPVKSNRNLNANKEKASLNKSHKPSSTHRVATKPGDATSKKSDKNKTKPNSTTKKDKNNNKTTTQHNNHRNNGPKPDNKYNDKNKPGRVNNHHNDPKPNDKHHDNKHSAPKPGVSDNHHNAPKPNGKHHHDGKHSAPKPGTKPHDHYKHHDYHPPRPGGGHWGPPPHNCHHWSRPLPPPPPPSAHFYPDAPAINSLFGLPFGTFIDYSINTLLQMGYNVLGYINNAIYMSNTTQFGYTWDDVQLSFNDGLFSSACLQNWSSSPSQTRFNSVYNQLCTLYGPPVCNNNYQGVQSYTWWGGNYVGYVSLEYGYGQSDNGYYGYYTNVIYGSNF